MPDPTPDRQQEQGTVPKIGLGPVPCFSAVMESMGKNRGIIHPNMAMRMRLLSTMLDSSRVLIRSNSLLTVRM